MRHASLAALSLDKAAPPISTAFMKSGEDRGPLPREADDLEFDVFLCHNSADKDEVQRVAERLRKLGLKPWLDREQLRPGFPAAKALQDQLSKIKSAAVFMGGSGIGPWQEVEIYAFLHALVERGCPVIPVLLPECQQTAELPPFVKMNTWVDLRESEPDPIERLYWGITGELFDREKSLPVAEIRNEKPLPVAETRAETRAEIRNEIRNEATMYREASRPSKCTGPLALHFIMGKYAGAEVLLPSSGVVRIGRMDGLEVELVDDMVSRVHAQILISDGVLIISDQISANGTFVNGEPIVHARYLEIGDRILLGTSIAKLALASGSGLTLAQTARAFEQCQNTSGSSGVPMQLGRFSKSGLLEHIPIVDLLRALSISRAAGNITIQTEAQLGVVYLVNGEIRGAVVQRKNNTKAVGRTAFLEIVSWQRGVFSIQLTSAADCTVLGPIGCPTQQLFTEAVRLRSPDPSEASDSSI
jgi:TIR domain/Inner membrane component of T3SS, cytoplasmic domain/Domain of unknown function (DUF4388)